MTKMKVMLSIILMGFLWGITGCQKQVKTYQSHQGKTFFEAIYQYSEKNEHNYVLLDIRKRDTSYANGHFFGFMNYDIEQGNLEELGRHLQSMHHQKKTIFIIDENGQDVEQVATYLASIGYRKIRIYLGGYTTLLSYNEQYFQVVTGLEDCDC
ncbi:MAG: rhodanese-like domain-containing protein [Prevotella sp.]|nr:rhodanese-like domain-containing protein [Staphylococcus sp.]MCM1350256.1 rhodanese-like domain-containing protein [Prevotella sp.]